MKSLSGWHIDWTLFGSVSLVLASVVATYLLVKRSESQAAERSLSSTVGVAGLDAIPYTLDRPTTSLRLAPALREISGLVVDKSGRIGWAINDEEGTVFKIDLASGSEELGPRFGDPGDYEAIERIGKTLIVSRSDGELFRIKDGAVQRIESPLDRKADVEGLAYDPGSERLLVACKGRVGKKKNKGARAVFALPWPELTWPDEPLFQVTKNDIEDFLADFPVANVDPDRAKDFAPSAIAVHPLSEEIYLLSTRARLLLVVDEYGEILNMAGLDRRVHRQPEGLDFDANSTLFISNEGRSGSATIARFEPVVGDKESP